MNVLAPGDPVRIRVRKCDPEQDDGPYYKDYLIPYTQDMRVLEPLDYIVEELGESLSYRWFCGVKKCGMCGMQINGRAGLACWEPVRRETVVEPLANFSVVRDLVIDRGGYESSVIALKPWLQREQPYWRSEDSANQDIEILNGLRPGMTTMQGAMLLCISSPHSRRGALWEAYRRDFGQEADHPALVWQADTASMNPSVDPQIIADAYRNDEAVAAAEYGG